MKNKKIQLLTALVFIMTSCEKLVEVAPPQDQLISSVIFESDETANSATTGIYASMMKTGLNLSYNISLYSGLYADELDYRQSILGLQQLYKYSLLAKDAPTNQIWTNGFSFIYQANALIEGLEKSNKVSQIVKNQLLGEALYIRSFWYYYLSNYYGKVPLVLATDYSENTMLKRVEVSLIHVQLIKDLERAKSLLSEKYVAGNSVSVSIDRIRPNTYVASALLARLYMQLKKYNEASEEATRIITSQNYDLSSLSLVFKRTSKEVIWQLELPTNTNSSNSYEASMFTLTTKPSAAIPQRCATISQSLLSLFSEKDKRKSIWIGAFTDNTTTPSTRYNFPSKYKTRTTPADEYTTPMRLAEIYLIRAEARAQLGFLDEAINDIDKIRVRAGIDPLRTLTPTVPKSSLLDSIAVERRRELFCEWGLRWFDIKRSTPSDDLIRYIATQKGVVWSPNWSVWPIPLNDILNSAKNLDQNEGYN